MLRFGERFFKYSLRNCVVIKAKQRSGIFIKQYVRTIKAGPGLKDFLTNSISNTNNSISNEEDSIPYLEPVKDFNGNGRRVFFEIYGCQMNVNDTEIIWSILKTNNYIKVDSINESDVVLVITCAIRDGAEEKIWNRLKHITALKKNRSWKKGPFQIGVLGCMAERLKTQLLEKERLVDIVAGPDSYKDLPRLLAITKNGQNAINVLLSLDETYADVMPVKLTENSCTAYVSIMRGCDNMCTYCIVPFTRGRERSRPIDTIKNEIKYLESIGIKEITLLGQNVNSYCDKTVQSSNHLLEQQLIVSGFKTVYKPKSGSGLRFGELLEEIAETVPNIRIRFTSPHPKDFPDSVLDVIKKYPNICNSIHLPAQSGNSAVLERMRRGYTREAYLDLVENIKQRIPNITLSSDFICGFCGETDTEFTDTLTLIERVKYNVAYLFAYSMREKTTAHRRYKDDVLPEIKNLRLRAMIEEFRKHATDVQSKFLNSRELILVEGISKRSETEYFGRNDGNIKVIIPSGSIPNSPTDTIRNQREIKIGDFICVQISETNSQVLKGIPLYHTNLQDYYKEMK